MKNDAFKVILLQALPASGKTEVRKFLANIDTEKLLREFHIGATLQLDDFLYTNLMRRIDSELQALGFDRLFYCGDDQPFIDGRDWGTLGMLLNEDYHDLMNRNVVLCDSAARFLFDRIDMARMAVGLEPSLSLLDRIIRNKVAERVETEARLIIQKKQDQYPSSFDNRTIVIECARGGADGSPMPLEGSNGYQYALPIFSNEILEKAAILYIWTTPEEARRRIGFRTDPDDPNSAMHHEVPMPVMNANYGCDDMDYLIRSAERPNTITIQAHGRKYHIPVGIFDNRVDITSFLRETPDKWDSQKILDVSKAIRKATDTMYENYR
ncbi:MAG: hypothetical protein IJ831_09245 [Spirochaetales bacterium]|nr:hypothetical protein [Spirochaetales bacterium]